jgi:hypothetical protein
MEESDVVCGGGKAKRGIYCNLALLLLLLLLLCPCVVLLYILNVLKQTKM